MITEELQAKQILDSIAADIAARRQYYEMAAFVDSLEEAHRKAAQLFNRATEDLKAARLRAWHASDRGYYFRWMEGAEALATIHPETMEEAHATFEYVMKDLGLTDVGPIGWFIDPPKEDQPKARERFLACDPEYFSAEQGTRGYMPWIKPDRIYVSARLGATTARTVAHELFHIWQARNTTPEQPTGAVLDQIEKKADEYGHRIYDGWVKPRRDFSFNLAVDTCREA